MVNIVRRSQDDTWDLVSERLTSEVDRASATLTERVAEVERAVQTRSAPPATTVEPKKGGYLGSAGTH